LIPTMLSMIPADNSETTSLKALFIGLSTSLLIASMMWLFADKLARLALARPQQVIFDSDVAVGHWQSLAFSVVGLWNACDGLVRLIRLLSEHLYIVYASGGAAMSTSAIDSAIPGAIFETALGLLLVFQSRGLVGLVRRMREYGSPVAPEPTSEKGDGA